MYRFAVFVQQALHVETLHQIELMPAPQVDIQRRGLLYARYDETANNATEQ